PIPHPAPFPCSPHSPIPHPAPSPCSPHSPIPHPAPSPCSPHSPIPHPAPFPCSPHSPIPHPAPSPCSPHSPIPHPAPSPFPPPCTPHFLCTCPAHPIPLPLPQLLRAAQPLARAQGLVGPGRGGQEGLSSQARLAWGREGAVGPRQDAGCSGSCWPLLCLGCLAAVHVWVPAQVEVLLGDLGIIPCTHSVTGSPDFRRVEWFITERDGEKRRVAYSEGGRGEVDQGTEYSGRVYMDPELSLVLLRADVADERAFSCQVTAGAAGTAVGVAQLRVYGPPGAPELTTNTRVLSVTELTVSEIATCTSRNANPAPTIRWLKDGARLEVATERNDDLYMVTRTVKEASGLQSVSSSLYLRPSKAEKDAQFQCLVQYPLPRGQVGNHTSELFSLVLHYFTENVEFGLESPQVIKEGDSVRLRCQGDGHPEPEYVFYRVQDSQAVEVATKQDGVLTLPGVSRADGGTYRCQVLDFDSPPEVQLEKEVAIDVNYLDPLTVQPGSRVTVPLGGEVTLGCAARGSKPPRLLWRKGRERVADAGSHTLRSVSYLMAGTYTCEASVPSVPGLWEEQAVQVTVEGKPELDERPSRHQLLAEGQHLPLNCSAVGHPEPQLTWSLPGVKPVVSRSGSRVTSAVTVEVTAALAKAGVWCRASNGLGEAVQHFALVIEPAAATPPAAGGSEPQGSSSAAVVAVVVCVLLLLIIVGFFYCLQRRGQLPCGAGEKRSLASKEGGVEAPAVEMKTDEGHEQTGLLSPRGGSGGAAGGHEC
ncbi:basal cell adhesion molecule, partial [Pelodiscus sinensis]|uniref:basal cell adhesion molecule n=1 Tax=Pelodiscus sinensis TaxID=13735 RepID=UPI003F6A85E3